jgi:hypothetical protein
MTMGVIDKLKKMNDTSIGVAKGNDKQTEYTDLPPKETLQRLCKAISLLDAIICQDWEYRYYSYNAQWGEGEEFFEMRNGQGEHLLILFRQDGCVLNGFHHEYMPADKAVLTRGLPAIYHEFIFGEPVASIGTSFCIWTDPSGKWKFNDKESENGAAELLAIFDDNPETYISWAKEYYEDSICDGCISNESVKKIYDREPLTKEIVLSVDVNFDDWERLQEEILQIGYPSKILFARCSHVRVISC